MPAGNFALAEELAASHYFGRKFENQYCAGFIFIKDGLINALQTISRATQPHIYTTHNGQFLPSGGGEVAQHQHGSGFKKIIIIIVQLRTSRFALIGLL